jgi:hypothetical protein
MAPAGRLAVGDAARRIQNKGGEKMDMKLISNLSMRGGAGTCVRLAAAVAFFAAGSAFAKTPDGMPPSEETVCSALSGAAFGLCNAYCEAQDCDVHPRPSCPVLRRNFEKITGSPVFPCDRGCGDEIVQRGEDCDPPGSECPDGRICNMDCTCPEPFCGDGIVDSGEQCDGSPCTTGLPCDDDCMCGTEPLVCCQCAGATAPMCMDDVSQPDCLAKPGCTIGPAGSTCDPELGRCVPELTQCCQCPNECLAVTSPDQCPTNCTPVPAPSACDAAGVCRPSP